MKIYTLIILACMVLQLAHSLPTDAKSTYKDVYDTNPELSDPNTPLRTKVRQLMHSLVADLHEIIDNTLSHMPATEDYDTQRQKLLWFLQMIDAFVGPLENCVYNIIDLTFYINKIYDYFERPTATAADTETMRILNENGWKKFVEEKSHKAWTSFTLEEFGPGTEMNGDYCVLP